MSIGGPHEVLPPHGSAPFARPASGVVAAKIITADGGEMTVVRDVGTAD